jgi:putative acetyltransferase
MTSQLLIRPETPQDIAAIQRVNNLAFGRTNEGELVVALKALQSFDPRLSLVAEREAEILGYVLFFPITIQAETDSVPALSLGPIAVHPNHQNKGIGGKLIRSGQAQALACGFTRVVLIGHPKYYPRFGYRKASSWGLTNPWNILGDAFMAIELVEGSFQDKGGLVSYPEVFNLVT